MNAPTVLDRKQFIGGSDAAAILGVSPWTTRLDLYLIKTGQRAEVVDPAREKLFRRGKRLEPVVVDMLVDEYAVKVTKRSTPAQPNRYVDPEQPMLAAEIDFEWEVTPEIAVRFDLPVELIGTIQNGEVKTVHPFASAKFGDAETDEVPVEYAAQAMHGLMVTGRQVCMFAVMVGADNLTVYFIRRDEETITGMRAQELTFWHHHVEGGVEPEPVNLPDVLELMRRRPDIEVQADLVTIQAWQEFAELRDTRIQITEKIEDLKYLIGKYMLGEDAITREKKRDGADGDVKPTPEAKSNVRHVLTAEGVRVLEVVLQTSRNIDTKALREKFPDAATECTKASSFFKFQSPKKGKAK